MVLFDASNDPHDGHDRLFVAWSPGKPNTLAKWILVGPIAFCEVFVDDNRIEPGTPVVTGGSSLQVFSIVLLAEISSLKKWNAHGPKVIGRDKMNLQRGSQVRRRFGSPLDQEEHVPSVIIQRRS